MNSIRHENELLLLQTKREYLIDPDYTRNQF